MRQFKRSTRLAGQILRDLSNLFEHELVDQVPRMVTFTHVRLSNDLRYATVFYSVLGDDDDRSAIAEYFEREKKHVRHLIGVKMHVRHIPELTFKFDPSIEEGIRIEQLLNEIKGDSKE